MMKEEHNEDFLERIKQALAEHQEPYAPGAWERFREREAPKQKPVIPVWKWAAAAALVAGIVLLSLLYSNRHTTLPPTMPAVATATPDPKNKIDTATLAAPQHVTTAPIVAAVPHAASKRNSAIHAARIPSPHPIATLLPAAGNAAPHIASTKLPPAVTQPVPPLPQSITPAPSAENKTLIAATPQKQERRTSQPLLPLPLPEKNITSVAYKKWQSSLYVSPVFSQTGVNMGYGYAIGYAISSKVKISSGIAHTKLSASRSFDNALATPPATAASGATGVAAATGPEQFVAKSFVPQATQYVQSAQGSVSGIDIPLELNYNFSKQLYAAGGVSALIVINRANTQTIVTNRNERIVLKDNNGTVKEDKTQNITNTYSTSGTEKNIASGEAEPVSGNAGSAAAYTAPLLGFYNFSVGYKQKVSEKNSVSIEPFIKVPMKSISQHNLNYTGVGVRLKFDF